MGRFQHLKITLEGNSSLGPELGDESGEAAATPPARRPSYWWLGTPHRGDPEAATVHTPAYQAVCQREPREQPSWPECQLPSSDVLPGRLSATGVLSACVLWGLGMGRWHWCVSAEAAVRF